MNKIASLPEEHNSSGFYPTPDSLAMKMLDGIRWDYISTILEPSAGKGNLADAVNRAGRSTTEPGTGRKTKARTLTASKSIRISGPF